MDELAIIASGYKNLHNNLLPVMLETPEPGLRKRAIDSINPMMWQIWHIVRIEDMYLNTIIFDRMQEFHKNGWRELLEIDTEHVGTGMTVEEANKLSEKINEEQLMLYSQAVLENTLELLPSYKKLSEDLPDKEEIDRRLENANVFPEGMRQNRAKAYAGTKVTDGLLGVLNHAYMHFGQYLVVTKPLSVKG